MPISPSLPDFHEAGWHHAIEVIQHRRRYDTLAKRQMMDAAERYNNAIIFPLPDVEGEPEFPPIAAAVIADAIDGHATRANDTSPVIVAPAVDQAAKSHRDRAELRKHAWGATLFESQAPLKMARAYRQEFGYGTFCFFVEADHQLKRTRLVTKDPLLTYPEPMANDEVRIPNDIGFVYGRSPSQLIKQYPEATDLINSHTSSDDDLWDVLDWTDKDWCYIGILGKRSSQSYMRRYGASGQVLYEADSPDTSFLVRAYPNRAGIVPAVCPQAVTLDRLISAISRIVPITDVMNKLAALNFLSAEKGVFPHLYALGENSQEPELLGGVFHDGRTGKVNLLKDVRALGTLALGPAPQIQVQMSDLERAARLSTGNTSVFQGEAAPSVRSGQTITQLAGYSVDPRVKEAHEVMGYALTCVNEIDAAMQVGYWPERRYTVFSGWHKANRHVTYTPRQIWSETTQSVVAYPMPGMDAQNATIAIAQLNQARMMSRKTGMRMHPLIDDPEANEREMAEESLDDAITMAAVSLVTAGQLAWTDLALIRGKVRQGMLLEEAIAEAQKEAQARQATEAPVPGPGQMMAPEAMPGLNDMMAGGQMAPAPAPPGPPPSQADQFEQVAAALMAGGGGAGVPA